VVFSRSSVLKTDSAELTFHEGGHGGPTVVLLHGLSDDGLCWSRVAARLQASHHLLALDARGHGRSSAPDRGYGTEEHGGDLLALLESLHHPCALWGHSMGADVAAWVASRRPALVTALVLEDPPWNEAWRVPQEAESLARRLQWAADVTALQALDDAALTARAQRDCAGWHPEEIAPWAQSKRRFRTRALDYLLTSRPEPHALARELRCPTLLLTGNPERGALVDDALAEQLVVVSPALRRAHFSAAGHNVHRDDFDGCAAAVTRFFSSLSDAEG